MSWPFNGDKPPSTSSSTSNRERPSWRDGSSGALKSISDPSVIVVSVFLTAISLGSIGMYKRHLRRIPSTEHIKPSMLRSKTIFGKVTSVGDGDNFRIFHTPGGRWAGWEWMPGRSVPSRKEDLRGQTIHVRLAGIDAPELPHFGRPGQPYGKEALEFLSHYILGKRVRAYVWRKDQYERVVATVYIRRGLLGWLWRRDVSLEMLKAGMATLYEAKYGSEFGNQQEKYMAAEERAKKAGLGMWKEKSLWSRFVGGSTPESPREFKTRIKEQGR